MNAATQVISNQAELILAANETLEKVYHDRADPCVALLVSRNYRLLVDCGGSNETKMNWMQSAKYWWQQYLKQSTGKIRYQQLQLDIDNFLFKPIDGL